MEFLSKPKRARRVLSGDEQQVDVAPNLPFANESRGSLAPGHSHALCVLAFFLLHTDVFSGQRYNPLGKRITHDIYLLGHARTL